MSFCKKQKIDMLYLISFQCTIRKQVHQKMSLKCYIKYTFYIKTFTFRQSSDSQTVRELKEHEFSFLFNLTNAKRVCECYYSELYLSKTPLGSCLLLIIVWNCGSRHLVSFCKWLVSELVWEPMNQKSAALSLLHNCTDAFPFFI